MKAKLNFVERDDGVFWMNWEDFRTNFDELYVCRFFDADTWPIRGQLTGEWSGCARD